MQFTTTVKRGVVLASFVYTKNPLRIKQVLQQVGIGYPAVVSFMATPQVPGPPGSSTMELTCCQSTCTTTIVKLPAMPPTVPKFAFYLLPPCLAPPNLAPYCPCPAAITYSCCPAMPTLAPYRLYRPPGVPLPRLH